MPCDCKIAGHLLRNSRAAKRGVSNGGGFPDLGWMILPVLRAEKKAQNPVTSLADMVFSVAVIPSDTRCLRFGLSLRFGLGCERPRCQIASDVGRAMRTTKVLPLSGKHPTTPYILTKFIDHWHNECHPRRTSKFQQNRLCHPGGPIGMLPLKKGQ